MENIFKIKTKSKPDPRAAYPSERRYSASMVLGLGTIHLLLSAISIVFLILILTRDTIYLKMFTIATASIFSSGLIVWVASIFASKRWYIDSYITIFFVATLISTIVSTLSTAGVTLILICENKMPDCLQLNVLIICSKHLLISVIALVVGFRGMRNSYPDDIIISRSKGKIVVYTVQKGNKKGKILPPDILNHFPNGQRNNADGNLPNVESCSEFLERVNRFLTPEEK